MLSLPILPPHLEVRAGLFFHPWEREMSLASREPWRFYPTDMRPDGKITSVREDRVVGVSDVYTGRQAVWSSHALRILTESISSQKPIRTVMFLRSISREDIWKGTASRIPRERVWELYQGSCCATL